MGGRIRAGCLGEEAERTQKGQRQGENLALSMRCAREIARTVLVQIRCFSTMFSS